MHGGVGVRKGECERRKKEGRELRLKGKIGELNCWEDRRW